MNISSDSIDLGLMILDSAVDFTFPFGTSLAPGGRIVLASNTGAFTERYGFAPFGEFSGNLNDGGELVTVLESNGVTTIQSFTYGDDFPWPESADGDGYSLVLIAPETNPAHDDPINWRSSVAIGGTPGWADAVEFAGDPNADDNNNGVSNLLEHAMGGSALPLLSLQTLDVGGALEDQLAFSYQRNLSADDVTYKVEISKDLQNWVVLSAAELDSSMNNGNGTVTEVWRAGVWPSVDTKCFVRLKVGMRQ